MSGSPVQESSTNKHKTLLDYFKSAPPSAEAEKKRKIIEANQDDNVIKRIRSIECGCGSDKLTDGHTCGCKQSHAEITRFFRKIPKEAARHPVRELGGLRAASSSITVSAMIHSPSEPSTMTTTSGLHCGGSQRSFKFSNVVRSSLETDVIVVVEVDQHHPKSKLDGSSEAVLDDASLQRGQTAAGEAVGVRGQVHKISSRLFLKRSKPTCEAKRAFDEGEVSVDEDFFAKKSIVVDLDHTRNTKRKRGLVIQEAECISERKQDAIRYSDLLEEPKNTKVEMNKENFPSEKASLTESSEASAGIPPGQLSGTRKSQRLQRLQALGEAVRRPDDESEVEILKVTRDNLAPVFQRNTKNNEKTAVMDPARWAARQAFLFGSASVTENGRKESQLSKSGDAMGSQSCLSISFPAVSRVHQADATDTFWNLPSKRLPERAVPNLDLAVHPARILCGLDIPAVRDCAPAASPQVQRLDKLTKEAVYLELLLFKAKFGDSFPVKKMFRRYCERKIDSDLITEEARRNNMSVNEAQEEARLGWLGNRRRRRCGKKKISSSVRRPPYDPCLDCSMQWTMKFAPKCADDVIGNLEVVREMQTWLSQWESRKRFRAKKTTRSWQSECSDLSSGDFSSCDFEDGEEKEFEVASNAALITGPSGVGKTASVYALAHDLGFKVLELNASTCRSGRHVLKSLQEATQSHNVRKGDLRSLDQPKTNTATKSMDRTTVILFEDIDVVFEGLDDGFYAAVNTLLATSKRPIILTTSNSHFMQSAQVRQLKCSPRIFCFKPISPACTAKYLKLMLLVEGVSVSLESLENLAKAHRGNISKTVLYLHFWANSVGQKQPREAIQHWDASSLKHNLSLARLLSIDDPLSKDSTVSQPSSIRPLLVSSNATGSSSTSPMKAEGLRTKELGPSCRDDIKSLALVHQLRSVFECGHHTSISMEEYFNEGSDSADPSSVMPFSHCTKQTGLSLWSQTTSQCGVHTDILPIVRSMAELEKDNRLRQPSSGRSRSGSRYLVLGQSSAMSCLKDDALTRLCRHPFTRSAN